MSNINNGSMNRVKPGGALSTFGSVQSVNNKVVEEAINTIETKKQAVIDLVNELPSAAEGVVETYLEENHVAADREFDTYAAYETAWAGGSGLAEGDNVYIKNDERFVSGIKPFFVRPVPFDANWTGDVYSNTSLSVPMFTGYTPVGVIGKYTVNTNPYLSVNFSYADLIGLGEPRSYKLWVVLHGTCPSDGWSGGVKLLYVASELLANS